MSAPDQLTLGILRGHEDLYPFWQESLKSWIKDALYYRNAQGCTGWSMVTGGFMYARLLYSHGQLSRAMFKRYWKFNRRIQRMETAYWKSQ